MCVQHREQIMWRGHNTKIFEVELHVKYYSLSGNLTAVFQWSREFTHSHFLMIKLRIARRLSHGPFNHRNALLCREPAIILRAVKFTQRKPYMHAITTSMNAQFRNNVRNNNIVFHSYVGFNVPNNIIFASFDFRNPISSRHHLCYHTQNLTSWKECQSRIKWSRVRCRKV